MPAIDPSQAAHDAVLSIRDSTKDVIDDYMDKYVNGNSGSSSSSSSSSSFDQEVENGQKTATAIGGGIIAIIIIVIVLIITSIIAACCIRSRRKDRARQHELDMKKYIGDNRSSIGSTSAPGNRNPALAYGQGSYPGYNYNQNGYGYNKGVNNAYGMTGNEPTNPPAYSATSRDG